MQFLRSTGLSLATMLVLLLGTSAPAMARMTCVITGHTEITLGQLEGCHDDEVPDQAAISATCCDVGVAHMEHAGFIAGADVLVPAPAVLPCALQPDFCGMLPAHEENVASLRGPPPLPGSQCLAEHGVYRL